jgi:hypothetical protein
MSNIMDEAFEEFTEEDSSYFCEVCRAEFWSREALNKHWIDHSPDEIETVKNSLSKRDKLKPHLLRATARLRKFIELDAPGVIIGAEAYNVFATTLAVYGESAGSAMIRHIRDQNLRARGVCGYEDCVETVEHPGLGICGACTAVIITNGEQTDTFE